MNDNVLIVVAHPDDELLWMWWTIQKLVSQEKKVHILLLAKTWNARKSDDSEQRLWNFKEVIKRLWVVKFYSEEFPDNAFDTVPLLEIIQKIELRIWEVKPEIVYTHFYNDLNNDHCITSKAVLTALRPLEKYRYIKKIYLFEVLSTTELSIWWERFIPNCYEDIEKYIDKKKELLSIYDSEINDFPHPRSYEWVETLAKYRGMECWLKHVEAFILYRAVN